MQILEILLLAISIILFGFIISKKSVRIPFILILFAVEILVFILHVTIDGLRWVLYPLYLAVLIMLIMGYITKVRQINIAKKGKKAIIIVLSILIVFSGLLAFVFPIYSLPLPSGDYEIGTKTFVITDTRLEAYTSDPNDNRQIKVQIWYPAETVEGYEQAPWLDGVVVSRALSRDFGFPGFVLDQTADIMSNSYIGAPINNNSDTYPIIIISHGWRGFRNLHTDFAEELASLGYFVVSIDHTYGSVATVFEEDDVAYLNSDALPPRESTEDFLEYANQLVNTYASDVSTTIDFLERLNNLTELDFTGKLDLSKIGVLGHSTGGGGDVLAAINDNRIDALIGLDAWVEPITETDINNGLSIPSLFLRSETWETGENNANLYHLVDGSGESSTLYQVDGTTHFDFAMDYMYSPLIKVIGLSGSYNSKNLTLTLKEIIDDFFNQTLRDDTTTAVDPASLEGVRLIKTN